MSIGVRLTFKRQMLRALGKLILVQAKLFMREPMAFIFLLFFPAVMMDLLGGILGSDPGPVPYHKFGFVDAATPLIASMIVMTFALMTVPVNTVKAREFKILRRFEATPMHPALYLVAEITVNYVMTLLGMLILIVNTIIVFSVQIYGSWVLLLLGFTLSVLAFFAGGYLIASLSPTIRIAQAVGVVLFLPMLLLSGASLPQEMMPESVRVVSDFLPTTHMVKLLQGLWFGEAWNNYLTEIMVLVGMLIVSVIISVKTFRWE